jgi:hypothetical protein
VGMVTFVRVLVVVPAFARRVSSPESFSWSLWFGAEGFLRPHPSRGRHGSIRRWGWLPSSASLSRSQRLRGGFPSPASFSRPLWSPSLVRRVSFARILVVVVMGAFVRGDGYLRLRPCRDRSVCAEGFFARIFFAVIVVTIVCAEGLLRQHPCLFCRGHHRIIRTEVFVVVSSRTEICDDVVDVVVAGARRS